MNHAVKSMRSPLKLGTRLPSSPAEFTRGSRAKIQKGLIRINTIGE
jgi:hypothetical protein